MITPRHHLLTTLILTLAACSTQDLDGDGFLRHLQPDDHLISMIGSIDAPAGNLRVKVDGQFLIATLDDGKFIYAGLEGGLRDSTTVPAGAPIDLINGAGQPLLHIDPVVPSPTMPKLIWVHDSPTGLVAEMPDLFPDDDVTTVEVRAVNDTVSQRVIASRCVGAFEVDCPWCGTTPANQTGGPFEPSACEALTTVGPGQEWTSKLEPVDVSLGGAGAACLALQDEGSVVGPVCVVELNRLSPTFQERAQIFIDGFHVLSAYLPNGVNQDHIGTFAVGSTF